MLFKGSGVAIVTPFKDGKVNYDVLGQLIEMQLKAGTDAIIFCGTTGESPTISHAEHQEVIRYGIEKVNGRCQVIAGTGSNNTQEAILLSKDAERAGADALLLITPYYNKPTQKGLLAHFEAIAKAVSIPIILYNVPSRTNVNILPLTVLQLAKVKNIVAIKEASGDLSQVAQIAAHKPDDFYIYSGNDDQILPILSLGGRGVISVTANIYPATVKKQIQLFFDGEIEKATKLTLQMRDVHMIMFIETNPAPVKAALNWLGYDVGKCRLPLVELSSDSYTKLIETLQEVDNWK